MSEKASHITRVEAQSQTRENKQGNELSLQSKVGQVLYEAAQASLEDAGTEPAEHSASAQRRFKEVKRTVGQVANANSTSEQPLSEQELSAKLKDESVTLKPGYGPIKKAMEVVVALRNNKQYPRLQPLVENLLTQQEEPTLDQITGFIEQENIQIPNLSTEALLAAVTKARSEEGEFTAHTNQLSTPDSPPPPEAPTAIPLDTPETTRHELPRTTEQAAQELERLATEVRNNEISPEQLATNLTSMVELAVANFTAESAESSESLLAKATKLTKKISGIQKKLRQARMYLVREVKKVRENASMGDTTNAVGLLGTRLKYADDGSAYQKAQEKSPAKPGNQPEAYNYAGIAQKTDPDNQPQPEPKIGRPVPKRKDDAKSSAFLTESQATAFRRNSNNYQTTLAEKAIDAIARIQTTPDTSDHLLRSPLQKKAVSAPGKPENQPEAYNYTGIAQKTDPDNQPQPEPKIGRPVPKRQDDAKSSAFLTESQIASFRRLTDPDTKDQEKQKPGRPVPRREDDGGKFDYLTDSQVAAFKDQVRLSDQSPSESSLDRAARMQTTPDLSDPLLRSPFQKEYLAQASEPEKVVSSKNIESAANQLALEFSYNYMKKDTELRKQILGESTDEVIDRLPGDEVFAQFAKRFSISEDSMQDFRNEVYRQLFRNRDIIVRDEDMVAILQNIAEELTQDGAPKVTRQRVESAIAQESQGQLSSGESASIFSNSIQENMAIAYVELLCQKIEQDKKAAVAENAVDSVAANSSQQEAAPADEPQIESTKAGRRWNFGLGSLFGKKNDAA